MTVREHALALDAASAVCTFPHPPSRISMKIVLSIVGGLVAIAIIAVLIVAFMLGSLVKKGVNLAGPRLTQTEVTLADADISPFSGQGTLRGLTVGNPAGWTTPRAFYLGEIAIDLEPRSLTGSHVVINSIVIDQPEITFETRITSSNLQDLLKNIQRSTGAETPAQMPTQTPPAQPQPPAQPDPAAEPAQPVKLEVKSFILRNAMVTVAGAGTSLPVEIPLIELKDLGSREGGLTPQQLAVAVVKEISAQVAAVGVRKAAEKGLFEKAGSELNRLLK
jgi:hypothetical protein